MGILDAPTLTVPRVLPPSAFPTLTKVPTPRIYRLGRGRFVAQVDLSTYKPSGGNTYYIDRAGSSGNTGATAASPWNIATVITAVNAGAGGDTVYMLPGEYQSTAWATLTKSCNWLATAPGARITGWVSPSVTWTVTSGSAGVSGAVYQTPKLSTNGVFDISNLITYTDPVSGRTQQDYTTYTSAGATSGSITADGQYAIDATNVYVRPVGAMDLTNTTTRLNIRLRQNTTQGIVGSGSGVTQYVRGVDFEGTSSGGFAAQSNALLIAEDCTFKYGVTDGTNHNGGHAIHIRCTASSNTRDGFGYGDSAGNNSEFLEIDCISHHNGLNDLNENNNATTSHETARGIRVGGTYWATTGPTVIDVTSAKTWNLGCYAAQSLALSGTNRVNWKTDTTAEMWLDECVSAGINTAPSGGTGTGYNFKTTTSTAKIHVSGFRGQAFPLAVDPASVGTFDYYTP